MADVVVDPDCQNPKELYGQGVRAYILQDFEAAVSALSKASELLVIEHKDDLHEDLGEVYLYYGKALLGLARDQNEALGDAVPKNAEESEDEEMGGEGEEEGKEAEDKTESNDVSSSGDTTEKQVTEEGEESNEQDNDQAGSANDSIENGEAGPSKANGDAEPTEEQNGDEDPSDLQVAWEVLELAKKIFQKQDDKKKLADTMITLGEISLESENFESAVNDIEQGLKIQKEIFSKDSRSVAETFYKLGMAYSTNSLIDEAVASFNGSLEYLQNRIKTLEEVKLSTQEHKDEIEEIKGLIPDIEEKITDMKLYKEEVRECGEMIRNAAKPHFKPVEGSVSYIEVKRKRTPLEEVISNLKITDQA